MERPLNAYPMASDQTLRRRTRHVVEHYRYGVVNTLTINTTSNAGVLVLEVLGDLDLATAPRLAEAITLDLSTQAAAVIVDLTHLEFLAWTGMNRDRARQGIGGNLRLVRRRRRRAVHNGPMKIVGLDREIDLYPTVDAALASGT
ncbi:MAG: anti-sigma factor antagonist [Mycobacterium sp.]|nr:anti-sigma factor antagonist [Mycobacterium sp.]